MDNSTESQSGKSHTTDAKPDTDCRTALDFEGVWQGGHLHSVAIIVNRSLSEASKRNQRKSEALLRSFVQNRGNDDPESVSPNSTALVVNLLAVHCKYGAKDALKPDTLNGYIQGLCLTYEKYGHTTSCAVGIDLKMAQGNPLIGNNETDTFRKANRVNLARYGFLRFEISPSLQDFVCDHAASFSIGGDEDDVRDIQLHCILVLGLYCGLRYEEISRIQISNMSTLTVGVRLSLSVVTKNSTVGRVFELRDCLANTPLRFSFYMDPTLALYTWLVHRGPSLGYLFCDVRITKRKFLIVPEKALSSAKFVPFFGAGCST